MEFLKVTQTRCETEQIASFGLKPAQDEENFQQVMLVEKGFTQIHRFSDGPSNLCFDCDNSWRSVFHLLQGPAITLK